MEVKKLKSTVYIPGRLFGIGIIATLLFLLSSSSGFANDVVLWAIADRPTSYILSGQDKGRGVVDEVYSVLHGNLAGTTHETQIMNFARVLLQMKKGKNLCATGFKKPEREKVGYFSIPAIIALPFSIIAKKERLKDISAGTPEISLKYLLTNTKLKGGVTKKRSYGDISGLIEEYESGGTLYTQSSTHDLMKMLIADRIDYAIEIPSFAKYIAKQLDSSGALDSLAIKEVKNKVLIAHIFCTKNEWGRRITEKIDNILRKERKSSNYIKILERWYNAGDRKIIRKYYRENFLFSPGVFK